MYYEVMQTERKTVNVCVCVRAWRERGERETLIAASSSLRLSSLTPTKCVMYSVITVIIIIVIARV